MKNPLWLVAALIVGACGGGSGNGTLKLEDYLSNRNEALCEQIAHCGLAKSVDECLARGNEITPLRATLVAEVTSGKIVFDGAAAGACSAAIETAACEVTALKYRQLPVACLTEFQGFAHEGAACSIDQECISQQCAGASCEMACCPGTCIGDTAPAVAAAGAACDNAICDDASYCDKVAHACMPLKGANASCESFEECSDGLYCLLSGVCGTLPAEGQSCGTDGCARSNDYCSATTHLCAPEGVLGAACDPSTLCSGIYYCDSTQHCAAHVAANASCRLGIDRCPAGQFCDAGDAGNAGICQPLHGPGEPCNDDGDCVFQCDTSAGTCYADQVCD